MTQHRKHSARRLGKADPELRGDWLEPRPRFCESRMPLAVHRTYKYLLSNRVERQNTLPPCATCLSHASIIQPPGIRPLGMMLGWLASWAFFPVTFGCICCSPGQFSSFSPTYDLEIVKKIVVLLVARSHLVYE